MDARVSQNEIPGVYDSISKIYDIWGKLGESRARNRSLELAGITDGQKILEVAVGTGLNFYEIVKRNPHGSNTGIDISQGMLSKARKRLLPLSDANYQLKLGNAFNLDEKTENFDLLMNSYMFDLIAFDEMDTVLGEFRRVLKKDAKLILVSMTTGESFGSGIYSLIFRVSPRIFGGCRAVNLSDKLQQNGFEINTREYCQQLLFPSEIILALKK